MQGYEDCVHICRFSTGELHYLSPNFAKTIPLSSCIVCHTIPFQNLDCNHVLRVESYRFSIHNNGCFCYFVLRAVCQRLAASVTKPQEADLQTSMIREIHDKIFIIWNPIRKGISALNTHWSRHLALPPSALHPVQFVLNSLSEVEDSCGLSLYPAGVGIW